MIDSKKVLDFREYLSGLKRRYNFLITDVHTHPLDVMGIVHFNDYDLVNTGSAGKENRALEPGFMEKMEFSPLANMISGVVSRLVPRAMINDIKSSYDNINEKEIIFKMEESLVDQVAFLSLDPWVNPYQVKKVFNNNKFLLLGSIDLHDIKISDIEEAIFKQIKDLGIVGLKLHPNLQNFHPQPSDNPKEIGGKLKVLYKAAEKYGLYLHFHGGISHFTNRVNKNFSRPISRSRTNALLKNFCFPDGSSEILGKYNVPIIIAHLGYYGQNKINRDLVKKIGQYDNVYFDTAAVSPGLIKDFFEIIKYNKILLGSDAFYNQSIFSMYLINEAIKKVYRNDEREEVLISVISKNFLKIYGKNL